MSQSESTITSSQTSEIDAGLRSHMLGVYREMSIALGISGLISWVFGHDLAALAGDGATFIPSGIVSAIYQSPLIWLVVLAPLAMCFMIGKMMRDASPRGMRTFLYAFAVLFGLSLAFIFVQYTGLMIAQAFFVTAGSFAGLSLWAYTTKKDISGWGSFLTIGLLGIILASIVNLFVGSGPLDMTITVIGVFIFAGFTAYDTQKLKNDYLSWREVMSEDEAAKLGTLGALTLFLDFVLLFQFILDLLNITSE